MITLYHYYLCSSSRYIRLILEEQKIKYETQLENYWKPQKDFLQLNPAGHLPVIVNEENFTVIGANACIEYIKDLEVRPKLFVDDYREKAEINILFSPGLNLIPDGLSTPLVEESLNPIPADLTMESVDKSYGVERVYS